MFGPLIFGSAKGWVSALSHDDGHPVHHVVGHALPVPGLLDRLHLAELIRCPAPQFGGTGILCRPPEGPGAPRPAPSSGAEFRVLPGSSAVGADFHPIDGCRPGPGPPAQDLRTTVDHTDPAHEVGESGWLQQRTRPDPAHRFTGFVAL